MNNPARLPNPLRSMRRHTRLLWLFVGPALALAGIWALRPIAIDAFTAPIVGDRPSRPAREPADVEPRIDPAVFAVNLWHLPPVPEARDQAITEAPPPPTPLNVQLIGIITEDGAGAPSKAALYDVDNDRLLIVADGDVIRDRTVRIVTTGGAESAGASVELSDVQTTQRLVLRPEGGSS